MISLQKQITCQQLYKIESNTYQICQKQLKLQNTKIDLEPTFSNPSSDYIKSIFQYSGVLNQIQINAKVQDQLKSFSMFSVMITKNVENCQFNASQTNGTSINFYGLAKNISSINAKFSRVIINFQFDKISSSGYSLAQYISGGITLQDFKDYSYLSGQSNSKIAMSDTITGNFMAENCTFNQYFEGQSQTNLFAHTVRSRNQSIDAEFSIMNSQFDATVIYKFGTNNQTYAYAFFQTTENNVMTNFENMTGNVGGTYNYLSQDQIADDYFEKTEKSISIETTEETLINTQINVNNTRITLGTYGNNISASGKNISLLGDRPVYYGVWISSSNIVIQSSSFTFLAPTITKTPTIANLLFNITVNATSQKVAGLSLIAQRPLTIENCTFAGSFNTTGSVYLLFESTKSKVTINNLTTQCDLSFMQDSYGLIKTVEKGVDIQGINSNISMNIIGDSVVTSSLMFDTVTNSSTIKNVTGYYGGYITNQTCKSSSQCQISVQQGDIQLDIKTLENVQITNKTSKYYNSKSLYFYQSDDNYLYKVNNTKVIFEDIFISQYSSYSSNHILISILGDPKIVLNTQVQATIETNATGETYIGGIAGIATTTNYNIQDTQINITFASTSNTTSSISDFFGILNTSASFINVTSAGHLSGSADIGGLIGILETGTATMDTVTIKGQYLSGKTYCGGVIGQVQSGATTFLNNLIMQSARISSMSKSAGPVYGEFNGSSTQFNVTSMDLEPSYYGGNCPVGSSTITFEYQDCPAKSKDIQTEVSNFALTSTTSSTSYHPYMTIHHIFENSEDLNNSKLLLTLSNMRGQSENRSLFGIKASYENVQIIIQNEPSIKWGSDSYYFGFLQAIIDDTTTSVNNVFIQSTMNGENYARAGGLCAQFSSNASVSNVTTNISKMYFWYTASFIYNISAYNPTFTNIKVNASSYSGGNQAGFAYQIESKSQNITIDTATIIGTAEGVDLKGTIAYQVAYSTNMNINNCTIKLNGQDSSSYSSYGTYCFYYLYSNLTDFENCTIVTNVIRQSSTSAIGYSTIASDMMFTDCNFTGSLAIKDTSYYGSSYVLGLIDSQLSDGQRMITNCKVFDQVLEGPYIIGGLIGLVSGSTYYYPTLYIDSTQVNVSIVFTGSQSNQSAGGFIGYINSTSATVEVTDSLFNDENGIDASCATMNIGYDYSSSSNISCYPQMKAVNVNYDPTYSSSVYNDYYYPDVDGGCYYAKHVASQDWNFTTFTVPTSSWSYSCGTSYDILFTFFMPDFTPSIVRNITIEGRITSKNGYQVNIALFHRNNPSQETTYKNIQLLNTFFQKEDYYSSYVDKFNVSGIVYSLAGNNNVNFINCVSNYTVEREDYAYVQSSANAFYFDNTLSSGKGVTLQNCSSNIQVSGYSTSYTTIYDIAYNTGNYTQN